MGEETEGIQIFSELTPEAIAAAAEQGGIESQRTAAVAATETMYSVDGLCMMESAVLVELAIEAQARFLFMIGMSDDIRNARLIARKHRLEYPATKEELSWIVAVTNENILKTQELLFVTES